MLRTAAALLGIVTPAAAQGLPVETGSHLPLWLWFVGVAILGLALAYGISRNRNRTRTEKQLTEAATRANYANQDNQSDRRPFTRHDKK